MVKSKYAPFCTEGLEAAEEMPGGGMTIQPKFTKAVVWN